MIRTLLLKLTLLLLACCWTAAYAQITYSVALDTSSLIGHPAGPFSLAFQLTDGSASGDGNNTAVISNFQFAGGSPSGSPTLVGNTTGSLLSTITLRDSSPVSFLTQPFLPGTQLAFRVSLTTNIDGGPTPDQFSFSILDRTGTEIPTQGGKYFDVFVATDITSSAPSLLVFGSDSIRTPAGGGSPTTLAAPSFGFPVLIDIKPGGFPNSINAGSSGTTPVAILSSATFDAPGGVARTSLTFGRTGSERSLAFCNTAGEDVSGDGLRDLVCHFTTALTGFQAGDSVGVLKGMTVTNAPLQGTDSVRIVPPKR